MNSVRQLSTSTEWPAGAMPERWVESLFERMLFTYGTKFSDQWRGVDPIGLKRHWAVKLGHLSEGALRTGVNKLDEREWPPTLSEFIKLCTTATDPTVAYYEAVYGMEARGRGEIGEWSHPAIFWAAVQVSAFDLKNQPYSQIRHRWEKALKEKMELGEWPEIPAPLLALPAPGQAQLSTAAARELIRQLKADGITKSPTSPIDHKQWARRILERDAAGDKTVTIQMVSDARRVLRSNTTMETA